MITVSSDEHEMPTSLVVIGLPPSIAPPRQTIAISAPVSPQPKTAKLLPMGDGWHACEESKVSLRRKLASENASRLAGQKRSQLRVGLRRDVRQHDPLLAIG
jgi:hypothetical protein